MTETEAAFLERMKGLFRVEAEEHLNVLSKGLIALEGKPEPKAQKEWIETIYREAHSLKGAARVVNFVAIQEICQSLESVLSAWKNNKISVTTELFNTLYSTLDLIKGYISPSNTQAAVTDQQHLNALIKDLNGALVNRTLDSNGTQPHSEISSISSPETTKEHVPEPIHQEPIMDKTIRVSTKKLDKLFQQVEETLIIKLTANQRVAAIKDMQNSFKKWEKQSAHMQNDSFQQDFIKSFKEDLDRLAKATSQDYRVFSGMVDSLLDDTKKVLMQPFSTLLETFPLMIRDLSHKIGKEVSFNTAGGDIEIDRRILEDMKDPLTHLLRNSLDHGIESPGDRVKKGKPKEGKISIAATQVSGNSMEIVISDDGSGIDYAKVKEAALKLGIISTVDADNLSQQEASRLVFHSGVSTSPIITDLSGRGLGMGIVSEKVEKLGGQIFLETTKDQGTTFRIVLPLSLATFRGIHVKISDRDFIVPTHYVKRVIRMNPQDIKTVEGQETVQLDQKTLSYIHLCDMLRIPRVAATARDIPENNTSGNPAEQHIKKLLVIIIKAAETMVAIGVDAILCEQEVFVKSLGNQLQRVPNISAATVSEWGKVIPILDAYDLVKSFQKEGASRKSSAASSKDKATPSKKTIIIAEDSLTARTLLKNIVDTAGYNVKTVVDGAEAFSLLKTEHADLLLSDIEMPRMDGIELTRKVRGDEKLKNLPIILCTSRGSREDREQGIDAGANAYLDKSNFEQSNLLDIIHKLVH